MSKISLRKRKHGPSSSLTLRFFIQLTVTLKIENFTIVKLSPRNVIKKNSEQLEES